MRLASESLRVTPLLATAASRWSAHFFRRYLGGVMSEACLAGKNSGRREFRASVGDDLRTRATRLISGLQVPAALRAYGALGEHKGLVLARVLFLVLPDDDFGNAALAIRPLDACRPLTRAAEPKPFFRRTALLGCLDEGSVDHDPVFREGDGTIRQHNSDQTRTRLATPTRAKNH